MFTKPSKASDTTTHWLNPARLRAYCGTILLASVIYLLRCAWYGWKLYGHPDGMDFTNYWAASRLWLEGTPLDAYSYSAMEHAGRLISPNLPPPGPLFYPPTYLLLLRPLAFLPSPLSYAIFEVLASAVFILLLRRLLPLRSAWLPILAFPGIWLTIAEGQNACVTASLALGALLLLKKRPIFAGVCIGMLSVKPHLAVLFPIVLACAGMWTTFIAAGVTAVILAVLSIAVFGMNAFPIFFHSVGVANHALAVGALPWPETASLFGALRALHLSPTSAYIAQGCQALVATGVVVWTWCRTGDLALRATVLIAGTCMVSPYLFNYDATWLGGAIAFYVAKALRDGWLRGEREILCLAWLYPGLGDICGYFLHIGIGPLVFASLLFMVVRRTRFDNALSRAVHDPRLSAGSSTVRSSTVS
jgi:hypothetical protein